MRARHLSIEAGWLLILYITVIKLFFWLNQEKIRRLQAGLLVTLGDTPEQYVYSRTELTELRTWIKERINEPGWLLTLLEPRHNYFQITLEEETDIRSPTKTES
jgi:hypothetical protein